MSRRTRSTAWCWAPASSWSTSISSATLSSSRSDADRAAHRAFVDLHCHTSWSPDSLSRPEAVARVAAERGLTHLAITDHGRIEGALAARDAAPEGLTVIVGEEIRSREGDLVALFVERPVPVGLSAAVTCRVAWW